MPHVVPICEGFLTGFLPQDEGPYALTPHTVEPIPTLGVLLPHACIPTESVSLKTDEFIPHEAGSTFGWIEPEISPIS